MYRQIHTIKEYLGAGPDELAGTILDCPLCGRQHSIPIGRIAIGEGLVEAIPDLAAEIVGGSPKRVAVIYDRAIEEIVDAALFGRLPGLRLERVALGQKGQLLDSTDTLGNETAAGLPADVDLIVGAGSGVISDLTKWIATKSNKPFILYGTAPSMNAHTSITSTITMGGIKTSVPLRSAEAVLFDLPVLATAPRKMLLAGLGDLTARAVCNVDWFLGAKLHDRYFCPLPFQLTARNEPVYFDLAAKIGRAQPEGIRALAEATLVSGLSMTMLNGETSPSSGTEHALSHFWDLQVHLEGAPKNLHGTQVAIATMLAYALLETLREPRVARLTAAALARLRPELEVQITENRGKFGDTAKLFNQVTEQKWMPETQYVAYLASLLDGWEALWVEAEKYLTPATRVRQALTAAGFSLSLDEIRRTPRQVLDSLVYGARYRTRYTLLDLAAEVGLLPGKAAEVLERSGLAG